MQILTAEQIRALDAFTIENEPISSVDLMERAATKCTDHILDHCDSSNGFTVFCGKGNNGGDGLVIARLLNNAGRKVEVIVVEHSEKCSADFQSNLEQLESLDVGVCHLERALDIQPSFIGSVVIDAMLGTGLNSPVRGLIADVAKWINQSGNEVISIDMPTGLFAEDNCGNTFDTVVRADVTLSFHAPKLSFLLPDFGMYVGQFHVLDIGLMEEEQGVKSPFRLVVANELSKLLKNRPKYSHKGTYGHALLIAGSKGKMGAAQLSAKACLRTGAGLLTCQIPDSGLEIMQTGVPEVMCSVDDENEFVTQLPKLENYNAVGFGPGVGTEKDTANALKRLIQDFSGSIVIDADGLNILGLNKTWLSFLPKGSILTPHPKEFERIFGATESSWERLVLQREMSAKYGIVIVLKGANTSIATPAGQVFFNSTGNSGMATAGSGDVLTGIILGLLAQGYSSEVAAILGVYLHGYSADLALDSQSEESMIAGDIIENLGNTFKYLKTI